MTGRAIGDVLSKYTDAKPTASAKHIWLGNTRRTFQPVRRHSFDVNDRRATTFFRPIANGTKGQGRKFWGALVRVAEQIDEEHKQPGSRIGRFGLTGIRVLREMGRMVNYSTGQLDPALDTLARRCRLSRSAVCAAIARLTDPQHGILEKLRRTEAVEDPEPFGPQVRQISNAYRVVDLDKLTAKFAGIVRRIMGWLSPKAAEARREHKDTADRAEWQNLSREETLERIDNPELREYLAAMREGIGDPNANPPSGENPGTEG